MYCDLERLCAAPHLGLAIYQVSAWSDLNCRRLSGNEKFTDRRTDAEWHNIIRPFFKRAYENYTKRNSKQTYEDRTHVAETKSKATGSLLPKRWILILVWHYLKECRHDETDHSVFEPGAVFLNCTKMDTKKNGHWDKWTHLQNRKILKCRVFWNRLASFSLMNDPYVNLINFLELPQWSKGLK